ncbi:MAG: MYXO-CTERM sorting domain-containing protein, partial [Polyangia bacterium]
RVPGYLQWKVDVPDGQDSITAQMNVVSGGGNPLGGSTPPKLELAVGPAGMPITWVVGTDSGNQATTAPFSGATGMVTATLSGLSPGPNYVMILNSGGSGSVGEEITFSTVCSQAMGCATADAGMDGGVVPPKSGGCSCELGGPSRLALAPLAFALLVLLGLALRRRRA